MEILAGILNFFLFLFIFNIMFSLVSFALNIYRNRETAKKLESEIKAKVAANNQEHEVQEMVIDEVCGAELPKDKAYILTQENGTKKYFCSWECRQRYIQDNLLQEKMLPQ
ncbi:MAG: hypothetical protein GXY91_00745 [Clostridia bacterium]|nr:hypothetical protein [Clostridia bacterium]